jgi:hypothetical protein
MTVRTLAEAAAEVLNRSKATATHEPMHTMPHEVVDLGGQTYEDPRGNAVGAKAAAARHVATPPGVPPAPESLEKMKKVPHQPQQDKHAEHTDQEDQNDHPDTAGHEFAHPHVHHEETEVSAEEEVLSETEETSEDVELTEEEIAEAKKAKHDWMKEKMKHMKGMQEDMDALFNGEDLSEDFKVKASTIYESAVIARAVQVVEELENEILVSAQEAIEEVKNELEEQVDAYLSYMVEEWINKNEVAIESGLKAEIAEEFMSGLKTLFAEHYISVPEEKVDVLSVMAEEIEELKSKLNEQINTNVELSQAIVEARKSEIVSSVCEGLTATQAEKVKTLTEGVEFTTEGDYAKKVGIIRENYFKTDSSVKVGSNNPIALTESEIPVEASTEVSPAMNYYVNALSRTRTR